MSTLRERFLAACPAPVREVLADRADLGARLEALVDGAEAEFPKLELARERFVEHLAAKLPDAARLDALHTTDLWLACACLERDAAALQTLDAAVLEPLRPVLQKIGASADLADEVLQRLRESLLVGRPGKAPELGDYAGRGPLQAWLRVMAVREATHALQAGRRQAPLDDAVLVDRLCPEPDPALKLAKQVHRADLSRAIDEAMATLSARERTVLRHHVLDDLSSEQIGVLYGVHRVTARRWLNEIRAVLLSRTRKALARRLGLTVGEADSLMRLVQSQVDLSLERFLVGD